MLPYNSYNAYLKRRFGEPVRKIPVNAGFSCPNRDGTLAERGCIYCNNAAFYPGRGSEENSISAQLAQGRAAFAQNGRARKFLAYFQPYSNTHAPVEILQSRYREALNAGGVVGLAVATRPDCLGDPVLDLLGQLSAETYLLLEIGLQSIHNETLSRIGRGHTFEQFTDAVRRARTRGLEICVHVILGLPGEDRTHMLQTADAISALDVQGVKLHCLHVCKDTRLAEEFALGRIALLNQDEYVEVACDFLERLRPDICIHRLAAQAQPDVLIAPLWLTRKAQTQNLICGRLESRKSAQGRCSARNGSK